MTTIAPNPITTVLAANSIPESKALALIEAFAPFFEQARELASEAEKISVTSADQKAEIAKAKSLRLKVKKLRTTAENTRKALKDDSLRIGKAIDGANGLLLEKIIPVEASLTEMEQIVERQEAERKAALVRERSGRLAPFVEDTAVFDLAGMSDEAFGALIEGQRLAKEKRAADEAKAAQERAEREAAEKAERDRLAAENARLQAERAEQDRIAKLERELAEAERREAEEARRAQLRAIEDKAAAERAAHQEVLKKEREAREQLERDAETQRQKRLADERAAEEARIRAQQAPDADKFETLAAALMAVPMPECESRDARLAVSLIENDIEKLAEKCRQHAARLRS